MAGLNTALGLGGIGFNLATGNLAGAGLGVAGQVLGALFGGGKESSVLQGFRVNGMAGANGFSGTVTAFDQLGHTWDAIGESRYLNSLGAGLVSNDFGVVDPAGTLKALNGASIPIGLTINGPNTAIPSTVAAFIAAHAGEYGAAANTLAPAGPPSAGPNTAPADPTNVTAAAQRSNAADAERQRIARQRGFESTNPTGGLGDTSTPSLAVKSLLGS